ncbi:alpha/beta hydrolase [Epidermidibacterium keratini]|uniref:Alpha/beta hydrolase n=1 Tax=Epidermidibacterium keratini TaxID=1891644 RepID=A0A7L4YIM3_9ACTN|nr:alpha/beta hydrolase [Epidermidibacterium keratini]QHB99244.1 alpha/beta hydrolase [Epidermidibacterium keratini]
MSNEIRGVAAGVPFIAVPPADNPAAAPIVVLWHLMDPPSTPAAFAAAIPLQGLNAWRVYLELPMTGHRLPVGGPEEIMRLGMEDAVANLFEPIVTQGAAEFPAALADVRTQLGTRSEQFALVGGSMGSAVAALTTIETAHAASGQQQALVMLSPVSRLHQVVDANAAAYGFEYEWNAAAESVAERLDFVARAAQIGVPLQVVIGAADDPAGIVAPAQELHDAVPGSELVVVEGMAHALADEPGVEAAPQTDAAAEVDAAVVRWLAPRLTS